MAPKLKINLNSRWKMVLLAAIVTTVIIVFGFFYLRDHVNQVRLKKNIEFSTIAKLKIDQIIQWKVEQRSNVVVVSKSPFFTNAVKRFLDNRNNNPLKEAICNRISVPQKEYGYENISLLTINGELLLSAGLKIDHLDVITSKKIAEAVGSQKITWTDLYYCKENDKINFDIIAPIFNDNDMTTAVMVFRIDPNKYLYPLVQSWVTPSRTSESLLVRKENDSVVFLNDLRHQKNTALSLKIPLTAKEVPAVQAVLGYTGLWDGKDYRGIDVVANIQKVPNTDWFMITKIDKSEMYADVYHEGKYIIIGFSLILLFVVAGLAFLYNYRQRNIFQKLLEAEKQIKASETKYRTLFNSIDEGFCTIEVIFDENQKPIDFRFLEINPSFEKQTGLIDAKGKRMRELAPKHEEHWFEIYGKIALTGEPVRFTNRAEQLNRWYDVYAFRYGQPEKRQLAILFNDITNRKLAEDSLRESEHRYYEFIEQVRDAVFSVSPQGLLVSLNKAFEHITGWRVQEWIGKPFIDIIHPEDIPLALNSVSTVLNGQNADAVELRIRKKSGDYVVSEILATTQMKNGMTIGLLGIGRDITDRKRAEKELILAKEHAEESDRLKSAFLANMSHEIRTPMNGILGFSQLLKEPNLTGEEQQEYISIIQKSGARLLNIIHDIVSISKIESGQMEITISETNINEKIEEIYTLFKSETERKGLQLLVNKSLSTKEAIIKTDREKLYAILTNLVNNSVKFTQTGSIEFGYEKKDDYLEFFVKDTGIGVPEQQKEIIFERFRQGGDLTSRFNEGTGLGLSISKAYVEMLGGKIWMKSELGKGSIFYFTISYNAETEVKTVIKSIVSADETMNHIKNLKILVVEDDESSEMLITITIRNICKEILKVGTGADAVKACRKNPDIDLVLMDVRMPEMDGYEATRQIRQFNKDVVIIAQTAYWLTGDRDKAIESGCNDYISKPIGIDLLKTLIQKHFNR